MFPGADGDKQLTGATVRGPRHLQRSRRGRHAAPSRIGLRASVSTAVRRRVPAAAVIAIAAVALSSTLTSSVVRPGGAPAASVALPGDAERAAAADNGVSRDHQRMPLSSSSRPSVPGSTKAAPKPPVTKAVPPAASAPPASPSPSPTVHAPVGGLAQGEMNNAAAIIVAGRQLNLPRRAWVVAIATVLQESHLRNLANANVPQSLRLPNEGVGYDHDSVGLFQQRPSWGPSSS